MTAMWALTWDQTRTIKHAVPIWFIKRKCNEVTSENLYLPFEFHVYKWTVMKDRNFAVINYKHIYFSMKKTWWELQATTISYFCIFGNYTSAKSNWENYFRFLKQGTHFSDIFSAEDDCLLRCCICSLIETDQHFRGAYCLHHCPDDGGS
jgi:hypothetical protein